MTPAQWEHLGRLLVRATLSVFVVGLAAWSVLTAFGASVEPAAAFLLAGVVLYANGCVRDWRRSRGAG